MAFLVYRKVEHYILKILRRRLDDCFMYNTHNNDWQDPNSPCYEIKKTYDLAQKNYYIKYGDMAFMMGSREAFMKQKHRLIWERRHGEVGSGMNPDFKPYQGD